VTRVGKPKKYVRKETITTTTTQTRTEEISLVDDITTTDKSIKTKEIKPKVISELWKLIKKYIFV